MNTILVTGGAGFIGSHLCKRLIDSGHQVICLDNFYSGHKRNIAHLLTHPRFELIRHDVTFPIYLEVDQVYHLACPASPIHYQRDPVQTMKTNIHGTINMLGLAKRTGARILLASTSEVYGDPLVHPQPEDYAGHVNPIGPRACYDEGKRCAETLFFDYQRQYRLDIRVVRIFNTYGPNMQVHDGRVISNFIVQALQHRDITIHGTGEQTRSFQFIDDLLEGLIRHMEIVQVHIGPLNIGNPEEHSVNELAQMVLAAIPHSRSKVVHLDPQPDDPKQRRPDITRAQRLLGWEPHIPLHKGLEHTIRYFESLVAPAKGVAEVRPASTLTKSENSGILTR